MEELIPDYLDALKKEISSTAVSLEVRNPVHSIYFGGGTPSLLTPDQVESILTSIRKNYSLTRDAEITLEMNPGDLDLQKLRGLRAAGINRASLGMQSGIDSELVRMGRRHTVGQVKSLIDVLHQSGFNNISLDLIFGYPEQTLDSWRETLNKTVALKPDHLSLYSLNVEEGTPLESQIASGVLTEHSDDVIAEMYEIGRTVLNENGFTHYEISNWSRTPEAQSRHNIQYWRILPYLGFGTAAHGFFSHTRTRNVDRIETYIRKINSYRPWDKTFPAAAEVFPISVINEMKDFMIFGLRMLERGIDPKEFKERFGIEIDSVFNYPLKKLAQKNLILVSDDGTIRLNPEYAFVSNQVFVEFI